MRAFVVFAVLTLFLPLLAAQECPSGYTFDPNSGVGCVQEDCLSIADAHYSYTGRCVCGSSGAPTELPSDPNKECYSDDPSCKGCVVACVRLDEDCPYAIIDAVAEEPIADASATVGREPENNELFQEYYVEPAVSTSKPQKEKPGFFTWLFSTPEGRFSRETYSGVIGRVKEKDGVRVLHDGKWIPAGLGTRLYPGDHLRTGPNSTVMVYYYDAHRERDMIHVRRNTVLDVPMVSNEQYYDREVRIIGILKGAVRYINNRFTGNEPMIMTPSITTGVRGTDVVVSYDNETKMSVVALQEGAVVVYGDEEVALAPGEQVSFTGSVPGAVVPLDDSLFAEEPYDEALSSSWLRIPVVWIGAGVFVVIALVWWRRR